MTGETSESEAEFITVTTDNEAENETSGMEYEEEETKLESGGRGTKRLANEILLPETREQKSKGKTEQTQKDNDVNENTPRN